jgi:hypothetical protein
LRGRSDERKFRESERQENIQSEYEKFSACRNTGNASTLAKVTH